MFLNKLKLSKQYLVPLFFLVITRYELNISLGKWQVLWSVPYHEGISHAEEF